MQHFDAIIIGAGISGISAAYHLQTHNPSKSYAILERRESLGGTWDLFNYPGIRSDSDMYTFGFSFRSWEDKSAIAEKDKILSYLHDTANEFGIDKHIQFNQHIQRAEWSTADARWLLTNEQGEQFSCQFLYMCAGYYSYDQAHAPEFVGQSDFKGEVIHPQFWPTDLDYRDKNVVVIGSGATAITLVPSMADSAKHVTMVQRSPTYLGSKPAEDPVANKLAAWFGRWAARWWFILNSMFIYWISKTFPDFTKRKMSEEIQKILGDKFDPKHFTPTYNPWDQRVCLCPDADFFESLKSGKASIETDRIECFTQTGLKLKSGKELDADMIVTATGLKVQFFGGMEFFVDNKPLDTSESYVYKGMMLSGVPNTFLAVGYTNASWTLKVDLTHRYASRLINYMDKNGHRICQPQPQTVLNDTPLMDLSSGYIQRSLAQLPKQADSKPWRLNQNFILDNMALRFTSVNDSSMRFS
ncbi:flavin-containing monooxygenase [Arenicella xantha]|uniref:Cation diffusion facilitator CzcD-associated flavoprotein CzcO n=1 Tax=Arenicella xantha TaxID=644221 RepID=A0A395JSZ7_9GAMM|nr:NAD(P)/FAD-dependent oxidoreductase [Arenicella xantha]RBP53462.1 cation diffusion facilitator CzcD-associated flavoprotein CzcO [Arenicella xantha]